MKIGDGASAVGQVGQVCEPCQVGSRESQHHRWTQRAMHQPPSMQAGHRRSCGLDDGGQLPGGGLSALELPDQSRAYREQRMKAAGPRPSACNKSYDLCPFQLSVCFFVGSGLTWACLAVQVLREPSALSRDRSRESADFYMFIGWMAHVLRLHIHSAKL